jgi:hypothetical protein
MTKKTEAKVQREIEEGRRILQATGNTDHYPVRFVVTHIVQSGARTGLRVMTFPQQGRNTYDTAEEAQSWIEAARKNNSASTMAMYGVPDTLEVRAVQCYPGHHDPVRSVFDDKEEDV